MVTLASLKPSNLVVSMDDKELLFKTSKFKEKAKFGLLRDVVFRVKELCLIVVFSYHLNYEGRNELVCARLLDRERT